MTAFPRFGPNGAWALFNDEGDVPPGWQPTEEAARRMQMLAPPPLGLGKRLLAVDAETAALVVELEDIETSEAEIENVEYLGKRWSPPRRPRRGRK